MRLPLLGGLALTAAGCASLTTLSSARTLAPGDWRVTVDAKAPEPIFDVGGRYGVTDRFEVGARVGGFYVRQGEVFGAAVDTKWQLFRSSDPTRGWDVALDPTLEHESADISGAKFIHAMDLALPLLLGKNFPHGMQLLVGPRLLGAVFWDADSHPVVSWGVGVSVGFLWTKGRFTLAPEIASLYYPDRINTAQTRFGGQVAIGLLVGP